MKPLLFLKRGTGTTALRPDRHRVATVVLAVLLVVALHALAFEVMAWMEQRRAPVAPAPVVDAAVMMGSVDSALPVAPVPAAPPAAQEVADLQRTADGKSKRFFTADEVDVLATPRGDWQLDPDELASLGIHKMSFEVLVDESGVPVRCRVLTMEPSNPKVFDLLAERLCTTRLSPAKRNGGRVPSVRVIELMLAT